MQISTSDGARNVVAGRLSQADGRPVGGRQISAAARGLRSEQPLGTATTDTDGTYRIEYPALDSPFDLMLQVHDGDETVLETLQYSAGPDEAVDLVLPAVGGSEYDAVLAKVRPLLDGSAISELPDDQAHADIDFLVRSSRAEPGQIRRLVIATRHAETTGLPAAWFYELLRLGQPADLSELAARPASSLQPASGSATEAVAAEGDLPGRLRAWAVTAAVNPPDGAPLTPTGELFTLAVPDAAEREQVYAAYLDHGGELAPQWDALAADESVASHVDRLRLVLQLGRLTGNNLPLVRELLNRFDDGQLTHPRDLAAVDWTSLVAATAAVPAEFSAATTDYAKAMESRVAEAYPTAYIAHRLATGPDDVDPASTRFLAGNPEFDLITTPVNAETVPDAEARSELAEIQRAFKIAPQFDKMQALRQGGHDSAYSVANIDKSVFAEQLADRLTEDEAHAVHARATYVHATAANILADVRTAAHFDVPWLPKAEAFTKQVPNWEELFGPADYGSFPESRSVHSQAAYFVDLLYFLRRLQPPPGLAADAVSEGWVSDTLKARRPDLWDIQLSTENTELTLPYVDLVNELLESAVVPEAPIPPAQRQSSGTSEQLRIQPQHVNPRACGKLRTAVYPWNLPLDLWREQTNAYLGHLGTKRESMLEIVGVAPEFPNLLTDERLGLDSVAAQIIAGESMARTLAEFYGLPASTQPQQLVDKFKVVRALLDTAGLRSAELTELLDTRFVNAGGALSVKADPLHPYSTPLMTIEGLDPNALERLHRFVRWQRALGWTAHRLDRVIQACNNQGRLDRITLRSVEGLRRLGQRLNLTIEETLVFYNDLETHQYGESAELPPYDQMFLDPTVVAVSEGMPNPFALRPDRTELAVIGDLDDPAVTSALLGILQVTDEDLAALVDGPRAVTASRQLNLEHLSALVRTVSLARSLSLGIPDLLRLIELSGDGGPFPVHGDRTVVTETELAAGLPMLPSVTQPVPTFHSGSESELAGGVPMRPPNGIGDRTVLPTDASVTITEQFLDAVDAIRAAGFTVAELDAVLAASRVAHDGPIADDDALAGTLTTLRTALQAVYQQTARTTDDTGENTRKLLTLLDWDPTLAQEAVGTLLGTVIYSAGLKGLADTVVFPSTIPVRYNATEELLQFTGPMTNEQRDVLNGLLPGHLDVVQALYQAPRSFVDRRMKALRLPVYSTPLNAIPAEYPMPRALAGKVYFDIDDRTLKCRGYLSDADVAALLAPQGEFAAVKAAVEELRKVQETPLADSDPNRFLTTTDREALFDLSKVTPADRFHLVLGKLNPVVRRTLSETTVKQHVGQAAGLDAASADVLLGTWLRAASGSLALRDFLAPAFVGSDPAVPIKWTTFGQQLTTLTLVHRVALMLAKLRVTAAEIPFLFAYAETGAWLDLNLLPAAPIIGAAPLFGRFIRLLDLIRLRESIPGRDRTLRSVFTAALAADATNEKVVTAVSTATGWPTGDVGRLAGQLNLAVPARFADVSSLLRLLAAVGLIQQLGTSAERIVPWLRADLTAEAAQTAWRTVKAHFTSADWPAVAAPMQDAIRERQRSALVAYLVANPLRANDGTPYWRDANGLHDHFLLDVEMGPTQLTSRIAQGIYSIQLFVQRCQLNLEPVVIGAGGGVWEQWAGMKQYRLWEANQKIFLYPENYFEPDLRPDKSPFFAELETDLMQKEITTATTETTFRQYLEKLSDVSRLQPAAMFLDGYPNWPGNTLLVMARDDATPRTHYLRRWVKRSYWTAWEKVELDIDSEAVVMSIWRNRLFLFWPTAKPVTAPPPSISAQNTITAPPQTWEILLNWSDYRDGKWSGKKVSRERLNSNIPYPEGYGPELYDGYKEYLFDPSSSFKYTFHSGVDAYSGDPVVWCHYNRAIDTRKPGSGPISTRAFGRFLLSRRHGSITTDPLWMYPFDAAPIFRRNDPDHLTENEGRQWAGWLSGTYAFDNDNEQAGGFPYVSMPYGDNDVLVLMKAPLTQPYRMQRLLQAWPANEDQVVSYRDDNRTYLTQLKGTLEGSQARYEFMPFYHAHAGYLLGALNAYGTDAMFNREMQLYPQNYNPSEDFATRYDPSGWVLQPYPEENMEFSLGDAYSQYNWELFFHAPLLMAGRLGTNQRFAEAQEWFHRIFDPTDQSGLDSPQRFWRTKPFVLMSTDPAAEDNYNKQRIEEVLRRVAAGIPADTTAVTSWLENPFQPDVVARIRTTAYQKAVVMKYLDNLIAWGDQLFRQDTLESINQATQLYILASQLLGRRPDEVEDRTLPAPKSYTELINNGQSIASALVGVENLLPKLAGEVPPAIAPGLGQGWLDYFRIPRNEKLIGYWDTVADRLLKIRSGENIDGVRRTVAAFGAVIDPAVLVRALASGADLATVLDDMSAPLPHYRFAPMLTKAKELTAEVKMFGGALLAALEKRDGEAIALLRSSQEIAVLDAARQVRDKQVTEAAEALAGLQKSRLITEDKLAYYSGRVRMNPKEVAHTNLASSALMLQETAAMIDMTGSVLAFFPELKVGFPTTIGASFGGSNLSNALKGVAGSLQSIAGAMNSRGALAQTLGGYDRRWDDWQFQVGQAKLELEQLDKQIAAATVRHAIAAKELENHDLQRSNTKELDRFMRDKYTNQELYDWMVGQLSASYVQAYQLAYDVAKRAERAYRHELGVDDSSFVKFGYWDSLHKGLLAGERLASDLNRMDAAFLDANVRELELSKRISLAQIDPKALLMLKETGRCFVTLPEALFDLDAPGHYLRRIKNVSVTVPCVAGPYTGVNLTARLLSSTVRVDSRLTDGGYQRKPGDTRFRDYPGAMDSIVTSTGQDDSGLFETNLRDERFLPFEGAGVVSEWQLSLPDKFRQFDYESITDVVLHLRYTARDGGNALTQPVVNELDKALNSWIHAGGGKGLFRLFSARREFADQWSRFLAPAPAATTAAVTFTLSKSRFPSLFRDQRFKLKDPHIVLVLSHELIRDSSKRYVDCYSTKVKAKLTAPGVTKNPELIADPNLARLPRGATQGVEVELKQTDQEWTVTLPTAGWDPNIFSDGRFNPEAVLDLLLVCQYQLPEEN
ncbi:neuraminidase-like domain-containing protein [Kribbella sp. NPDC006257]|uniref:Tc toxin subunit A-related protein n=1 Tax=Kribbella sp. NPDC006257 TaxID=3156738 RepID=UPI0033A45CB4